MGVWVVGRRYSGECLSRASCKEDVAEERCFLTDKGKASLRQDVWAWPGPALAEPERGKGNPLLGEREETPLLR